MKKLSPAKQICIRDYVAALPEKPYPSLLHLVEALFSLHTRGDEDLHHIFTLLDELGYRNLKEIPESSVPQVRATIMRLLPQWEREQDPEQRTYLLLAAIVSGDIKVFIDDELVTNIEAPITIYNDSVICFIDQRRIAATQFQIL